MAIAAAGKQKVISKLPDKVKPGRVDLDSPDLGRQLERAFQEAVKRARRA